MTGGRMGAEGDPTTIIVYADVYTQETPSTSEHELSVMMSSSDPSSPTQASISTTSFDVLDDARLEKINVTPVTSQLTKPVISPAVNTDADAIEEAVPIVQTTLPVPESVPKLEKNGIEVKTKKSPDEPNDECLINCIYFTQQCCDCTIS
ncbi:centrosomal protein of 97 kDa isoform X3 [Solenopsis invicta]|uniref:centrosomal protein of 97 kDa isoform X3 n=1 Tax=Solenopsis invicta TaxID=13686 RepID=UPI00059613D3|nr:centrosomal protein of 97 kDa isoform X3 [Solenopsis invicta]